MTAGANPAALTNFHCHHGQTHMPMRYAPVLNLDRFGTASEALLAPYTIGRVPTLTHNPEPKEIP